MVTYFNRKTRISVLFLLSGVMSLFSSVLSLLMGDNSTALVQFVVFIIFSFNAYIYRRPYVGLGEGKLVINNGLVKKEIVLTNISSMEETIKKIKLSYTHNAVTKKAIIVLSVLKPKEKELFLSELQLQLGKQV